jgi:hypothetical protein
MAERSRMLICLFRSCAVWRFEILEEERAQQAMSKRDLKAALEDSPDSDDEYPPNFSASFAPVSTHQLRPQTTDASGTRVIACKKRNCEDESPERASRSPLPTLVNSSAKRARAELPVTHCDRTPPAPLKPRPRPVTTATQTSKLFFGPKSVQQQQKQ